MGPAILSDLLMEILISVAAIVGIVFALIQWTLVSKVKLSPEQHPPASGNKNGYPITSSRRRKASTTTTSSSSAPTSREPFRRELHLSFSRNISIIGVFMVAFAVLIFLFLGSVKGFSTKSQPCTYSKDKTCKPALANAFFSRVSFLLGAITSVVSGFLGMKIATYICKCQDYFGGQEGCWKGIHYCIPVWCSNGVFCLLQMVFWCSSLQSTSLSCIMEKTFVAINLFVANLQSTSLRFF